MSILGVDEFKAKLAGGGARPNLFKVELQYPAIQAASLRPTDLASFMCNATSLPASTINPVTVPFRGRQLYVAGDRTFAPWSVNIINDTNFEVRRSMESWMNAMNGHQTNTGEVSPEQYQSDMTVVQLDKNEDSLYSYTFRGCFPTNISEIALSYGANDTIEEFNVSFMVQYWESYKGFKATGHRVTS